MKYFIALSFLLFISCANNVVPINDSLPIFRDREDVGSWINKNILVTDDSIQYNQYEYWASA